MFHVWLIFIVEFVTICFLLSSELPSWPQDSCKSISFPNIFHGRKKEGFLFSNCLPYYQRVKSFPETFSSLPFCIICQNRAPMFTTNHWQWGTELPGLACTNCDTAFRGLERCPPSYNWAAFWGLNQISDFDSKRNGKTNKGKEVIWNGTTGFCYNTLSHDEQPLFSFILFLFS